MLPRIKEILKTIDTPSDIVLLVQSEAATHFPEDTQSKQLTLFIDKLFEEAHLYFLKADYISALEGYLSIRNLLQIVINTIEENRPAQLTLCNIEIIRCQLQLKVICEAEAKASLALLVNSLNLLSPADEKFDRVALKLHYLNNLLTDDATLAVLNVNFSRLVFSKLYEINLSEEDLRVIPFLSIPTIEQDLFKLLKGIIGYLKIAESVFETYDPTSSHFATSLLNKFIEKNSISATIHKALKRQVDRADKRFDDGDYFGAYDEYKAIVEETSTYMQQFSSNLTNELLWSKSGMFACKRATKTVSVDQAIFDLEELRQDLITYADTLDPIKKKFIHSIYTTATKFYSSGINCANAEYEYATNVVECLDHGSRHSTINSLKKIIIFPDSRTDTFKKLQTAHHQLKNVYDHFKYIKNVTMEKKALHLLAELSESIGDYMFAPNSNLEELYKAIYYYELTIQYLKIHGTVPSIDLHLSILYAYHKLTKLNPNQVHELHLTMKLFIEKEITLDVIHAIPEKDVFKKIKELNRYKSMVGMTHSTKRPLNQSDSIENIYDDPAEIAKNNKKRKVDTTGLSSNSIYKSNESTSESAQLSTDILRPTF